jgi:surfeit locus 1 family protein
VRPRSILAGAVLAVAIAGFVALGFWQLERRAWKLDLIAQVDARLAADPAAAPGPDGWPDLAADDAYTRVEATGRFLHDREVAVLALTDLGSGYWVLSPLATDDFTVLVNRGFVPQDRRDPATRPQGQVDGPVTVTGLLRVTEPHGGFLRANDPASDRWYSRDVAAIAEAEGLGGAVAPYFIDAGAAPNPGGLPVGGLTVVDFRNAHLSYALTWFGLAALIAFLAFRAVRGQR